MSGRRNGRKAQTTPLYARKTTQLPSKLKDELVSLGKIAAPKAKRQNLDPTTAAGRKQLRKQERQDKGGSSQGTGSASRSDSGKNVKQTGKREAPAEDRKGKKRQRLDDDETDIAQAVPKQAKIVQTTESDSSSKKKTPLQQLLDKNAAGPSGGKSVKKSRPVASGSASTIEEQEDAEIAWLEAQLGLGKNSKSRKEFEEDGLDDILDDLDKLDEDLFGAGEASDGEEISDEDEDGDLSEEDDSEVDDSQLLDEDEGSEVYSSEMEDLESMGGASVSDEDESDGLNEGSSSIASEQDQNDLASSDVAASEESKEVPSKYVPPALRRAQEAAAAKANTEDPKLRRQLMGLLNRLSPTSFPMLIFKEGDSSSLNHIYLSNPRAIVSKLLVSIIPDIVSSQGDGIGETQIVVLSALVKAISGGLLGGMSVSGGTEFGATLVDHLIRQMDRTEHSKKERSNLIHFLAMLYNMQVVACTLLYDMIKEFIEGGLSEDNVEALVKIVRVSGPQLRHDDPTALKQIIQLVAEKQKALDTKDITTRTKFMIEQLTDLKNNKIKPSTGVAAEAESSLKKYISNLGKKSGHEAEPLRMSLADLRAADQKGKWWLVGAAWSGNPLLDQKEDFQKAGQKGDSTDAGKEAALLKLAKKQGMNTDTRRQIFIAVMGAEDYIDAAQRVSQLGLKEIQQREIIRVLLHCLGNEKAYNPFYTLVVSRLLNESPTQATHSYQITLQYALWDFFRSLGEDEVGGASMAGSGGTTDSPDVAQKKSNHLARAYAWWCAKSGLSLNILKPLPFLRLQPASNKFLGTFFTNLFISTQTNSPLGNISPNAQRDSTSIEKVFLQVANQNANVAQGVGWYLQNSQTMRKQASKNELVTWGIEVAVETLQASERLSL